MATVSIVIPSYNRSYLIAETLESILAQSYEKWECIVVDDHSTDNTEEVVAGFTARDSRIRYARRPSDRPKGANACRNYGFEISNGNYINWFDSDDIMAPDHLRLHLHCHVKTDVDAVVSAAKAFLTNASQPVRDCSQIIPEKDLIQEMIATKVLWQTNCVTWNRASLPVRPFLEDLGSSQEWTFHLSRIIEGSTFKILPQTTCFVRDHHHRIGKLISVQKSYSTFASRKTVMLLLRNRQMLDKTSERGLLKYIFHALRQSIDRRYNALSWKIIRFLAANFANSQNKAEIAWILFVAVPVFFTTRKGEKLFRLKL